MMIWILATDKFPTCIVAESSFDTNLDTVIDKIIEHPALNVFKGFNNFVHSTPVQVVKDFVDGLSGLEWKPHLNEEEKVKKTIFLQERAYFEKNIYIDQDQRGC